MPSSYICYDLYKGACAIHHFFSPLFFPGCWCSPSCWSRSQPRSQWKPPSKGLLGSTLVRTCHSAKSMPNTVAQIESLLEQKRNYQSAKSTSRMVPRRWKSIRTGGTCYLPLSLQFACQRGDLKMAKLLLNSPEVKVDSRDADEVRVWDVKI